jgi:hypothetical protein
MRTGFSFRFMVPWATLILVVLLISASSFGQVDYSTATLQGTVLDAQSRAVPAATVTIANPDTGLTKSQQSGADGTYNFPLLAPGTYQITVAAAGFDKSVTNGVGPGGRVVRVEAARLELSPDSPASPVPMNGEGPEPTELNRRATSTENSTDLPPK